MNPRIEKYMRVVEWARARYTDKSTYLLVIDTAGVKSTYSRIEDAAFAKYMTPARRHRVHCRRGSTEGIA